MVYGTWDDCPLCNTGLQQSPIDIVPTHHTTDASLRFDYQSHPLNLINSGTSIKMVCDSGSMVCYNNQHYALQQLHFHHPAEHTINSKTFPLEAHLVHQASDGHLLVVAVLVVVSKTPHADYDMLWSELPKSACCVEKPDIQINLINLLPRDRDHFYQYNGSLTTPPCTEGVTWIVMSSYVGVSQAQLDKFISYHECNNRPIQNSNARDVFEQ